MIVCSKSLRVQTFCGRVASRSSAMPSAIISALTAVAMNSGSCLAPTPRDASAGP